MIDLTIYANIKDKCCVGYFGFCSEYVDQLLLFRSSIEAALPGLTIYIGCRDDDVNNHLDEMMVSFTNLRSSKLEYGKLLEVLCDTENHPVEKILLDLGCQMHINNEAEPENSRCLIVNKGQFPTKSLTDAQTQDLMELAVSNGLRPEFGEDAMDCGHVWGVESRSLWRGAMHCQKGARLIPTGVGSRFYRTTFPHLRLLELQ